MMLRHAEHCLDAASHCVDEMQRVRFIRAAKAWRSLSRAKRLTEDALLPNDDTMAEAERAVS